MEGFKRLGIMEISKSVFGLAKTNNGFFKSDKQAEFLIHEMSLFGGLIGNADSGFNSCPIFASWDAKGITKIVKSTKNGDSIMFERKIEGKLTSAEIKNINSLKRKLKSLEREFIEIKNSFQNGSYNKSGDKYTYDYIDVELYCYFQNQKIDSMNHIKEKLNQTNK